MRVRRRRGWFCGVLATCAVHFIQSLGLRVVGLHLLIADRPRGGDAVMVVHLAEILAAHAIQGGAVQLGRAAHVVVNLWLKWIATGVVPCVGRDVAVIHEHLSRTPVLWLAWQPSAALEHQDALA